MTLPVWFEVATFAGISLLLLADLLIVARRPHEPSMRESTVWVSVYVVLALLFGLVMLAFGGGQAAGEFYAGWLTEYSLSVDNLFVFVIIMARFAVPRRNQQQVLMIGIIMALVLRGIFILVGAAAINQFAWLFWIFGGFLIYTAVTLARHSEAEEDEFQENVVIRRLRTVLPMHPEYDGAKIRTVVDGRRLFTPMVVVLVAIATTDLLFALDSIPAIFGLTQDPFIVFTANVFALMGLRQLYFLLGGLLDRLVYLSKGLAVILGFIGVKLMLQALHENTLPFINGGQPVRSVPEVPIWLSLGVILATLAVATVASLARTRAVDAEAPARQRDELAPENVGGEPPDEG